MLNEYAKKTNVGIGLFFLCGFLAGGIFVYRPALGLLYGVPLILLAQVFFIWGCCMYAKAKGYHPAVGLAGLFSILGLLILGLLPDKQPNVGGRKGLNFSHAIIALVILLFFGTPFFLLHRALSPMMGEVKKIQPVDEEGFALPPSPIVDADRKLSEEDAKKELQRMGIGFNKKDFFLRLFMGDVKVVYLYLKSGMSPDEEGDNGETPLSTVISAPSLHTNQMQIMRELLRANADIRKKDYFKLALDDSNLDAFQALLKRSQKIDFTDWVLPTLAHAVYEFEPRRQKANLPFIQVILDSESNLHTIKSSDKAFIYDAISMKNFEAAKLLIKKGLNLNTQGEFGTPLHQAIDAKQLDLVTLLIKKGADLNAEDKYGETPLLDVIYDVRREKNWQKEQDVMLPYLQALVSAGADVNKISITFNEKYRSSPLEDASNSPRLEKFIPILKGAGAKESSYSFDKFPDIKEPWQLMNSFTAGDFSILWYRSSRNARTNLNLALVRDNKDLRFLQMFQTLDKFKIEIKDEQKDTLKLSDGSDLPVTRTAITYPGTNWNNKGFEGSIPFQGNKLFFIYENATGDPANLIKTIEEIKK